MFFLFLWNICAFAFVHLLENSNWFDKYAFSAIVKYSKTDCQWEHNARTKSILYRLWPKVSERFTWGYVWCSVGDTRDLEPRFLFKNRNSRFSHENLKRVWNLLVLKNAKLENTRVRGRGSEISPSLSHSRSLALALTLECILPIKNKKSKLSVRGITRGRNINARGERNKFR